MDIVTITSSHSVTASRAGGGRLSPAKEVEGDLPKGSSSASGGDSAPQDKVTLSREAVEIQKLATRDTEVKTHEQAHAAKGGSYAGAPTYGYQQGPDGKRYAVSGEVPIDVTPVSGDPAATLKKAETIRSAALAPAQPSAQDRNIAAKATMMATKARTEVLAENVAAGDAEKSDSTSGAGEGSPSPEKVSGTEVAAPRARFRAVA